MKRILIIGSGGAGKSTLARQLGEILGLPVIHLDAHFWGANWQPTPAALWQERVQDLVQAESWVMDGNFSGTLKTRLEAADTVIFLDFPRTLCLRRVVGRWWKYRNQTRPDMAPGCQEKLDWEFLSWIWNYPKRKSAVLDLLSSYPEMKIYHLQNPREISRFLEPLSKG